MKLKNNDTTLLAEAYSKILESHNLNNVIANHQECVQKFKETGEISPELMDALYDYYTNSNEMPYGVAKARTGDPEEWITKAFERDLQHLPNAGSEVPRV